MVWLAALLLPPLLFWLSIPNSPQIFGKSVRNIQTDEKVIALTFDDGPLPEGTPKILEVLKKYDVRATFFVLGKQVEQYPDLLKQAHAAGHEIGNHSWSHPLLIGKRPCFVREQVEKTDAIIRQTLQLPADKEIYFRCPYGMKLFITPWVLKGMKRKNILFDAVGWDWDAPGAEKIAKNIMDAVHKGSIILLHDGCGNPEETAVALDMIINELKKQEYRFVTVSELLALRGDQNKKSEGKGVC